MKKVYTLLFAVFAMSSTQCQAQQQLDIYPTPQKTEISGKTFNFPTEIQVQGLNTIDEANQAQLQKLITPSVNKKAYKILIGKKGDVAIKKFANKVPEQAEGYYLSIDSKQIVIAGKDDRAIFYALQTLEQIINRKDIPEIEITDYPDVPFRGVVEGFYGTPWSFEDRLSQIEFYGKTKMNTYIYGPKDDPYHSSPNWRKPYPSKEAENIKALVKAANENKVNFVWAIHPGQDIKWNDEDRQNLINKFQNMYQLGVRSFAVFFDDISGEGAKADKQAELLNYIDNEFIQNKTDITPLIMCPTEYNKSWANVERGYLPTLGNNLNPSINVMWTGDKVCIDISKETVDWINPLIKRSTFIWWNFPVTDYIRNRLLMGRVYGNDTNLKGELSGFVSNPMEHAEASKIAIFGVGCYAWNLDKYDSEKAWDKSIELLMPSCQRELKLFASHNSDQGTNGHKYRKEESVEIQPVVETALKELRSTGKIEHGLIRLHSEFDEMIAAADILLTSDDNKALSKELKPWLAQFKNTGERAKATLTMLTAYDLGMPNRSLLQYKHIQALNRIEYDINQTYNMDIKTATLVIQPFIKEVFETAVKKYNEKNPSNPLDYRMSYCPHSIKSDIPQLNSIELQVRASKIIATPVLEIVKWQKNQYVEVELEKASGIKTLEFDFENENLAEWLEIEINNNSAWSKVAYKQENNKITINLNNKTASKIRFKNIKGEESIKFKSIQIDIIQ